MRSVSWGLGIVGLASHASLDRLPIRMESVRGWVLLHSGGPAMTKILAFADLHMGAGSGYSDDRLADQEAVLNQIVKLCRDDIDLVLLAGDIFHRPKPAPATLLAFRRFVDKLADLEVPCIACRGNVGHDQEGFDRPCALDLFESRLFRVSSRPELITEFAGVAVATLPSVPVSRLVAGAESSERGPVFVQAAEALLAVARELYREAQSSFIVDEQQWKATPGTASTSVRPTILMGHWSLSGASLPNGLPVADLAEPILDLGALEEIGYDAMVFGHIHNPQPLGRNGFYCGSPLPVDFGEADVDHGVRIFDFDHTNRFVPLASRSFVTIDYDFGSVAYGLDLDETDELAAAIAEHFPLTDAVVRLRYRATEEQHRRIDTAAVKKLIMDAGAHRIYQVAPEIVREDRARVAGVDENLAPEAALEAWCAANEIGGKMRADLAELLADGAA